MSYHIRIDIESKSDIVQKLLSVSSKWAYAQEGTGSNLHTHILCVTDTPENTFRRWIRQAGKDLGLSGNKFYSSSAVRTDETKTLAYIIKGGNYQQQGFDDIVEAAMKYDIKVKEKKKGDAKSMVNAIWEMLPEVVKVPHVKRSETIVINKVPYSPDYDLFANKYIILCTIAAYHNHNNVQSRRNTYQSVFDTIMIRLIPYDYVHNMLQDDSRKN